MNKIFKVVWSKVKHCYVVASELAKSKTKSPSLVKSGKIARLSLAIVVALNSGMVAVDVVDNTAEAASTKIEWDTYTSRKSVTLNGVKYWEGTSEYNKITSFIQSVDSVAQQIGEGRSWTAESASGTVYSLGFNTSNGFATVEKSVGSDSGYLISMPGSVTLANIDALKASVTSGGGTTYTAGTGITISGSTISAKPGTGITVDGSGISIVSGNVAAGDSNAITGRTAYSELRPNNGNYVNSGSTTAANLTALDTQAKKNADAIAAEVTNRTTAVNNEKSAREAADTALSNRIGTVADGHYIKASNNVAQNLKELDDKVGDNDVVNGSNFLRTSNTVNMNLKALDTQAKNTADSVDSLDEAKAEKNASNVAAYAQQWADAIGTGTVTADDTKLVTGKTVYDALHDPNGSIDVKEVKTKELITDKATIKELESDKATIKELHTDTLEVNKEATFHDNATFEKDIEVKGTTTTKTLHVTENATVDGDLTVNRKSTFEDDVHMKNDLDVDGKATVGSLEVEGNGKVGGNWTVMGNESVEGNSHIYGKQTVDGKSTVGSQEVLGDSIINGNQTIKKDLTVEGKSHLKGDVTMDNNAEIGKNLTVKGDSDLQGNAHVGKDLTVDGNGEFGKDLHVVGESKLDGKVTMGSDASVAGNFSVAGKTELKDTLVDGTLEVNKEATFHDNVAMDKDLAVAGNASIGKDLTVEGKTTLKDILTVAGDAVFQNNASVGKDLSVAGTSNLQDTNVGGKLDVTGESAFHDNVTMDKDLAVAGNADVAGNGSFGGDLRVKGKSTFEDDVAMQKNLDVAGNSTVGGTLDVTGASNFHDNVTMDKDLKVSGNSDVAGNGTFGGDLTVTGKTTLKDLLSVAGDADFKKNANVGKDLSVAGTSNLHDTNVNGKLDVTGESAFHDKVTMDKDLSVAGNGDIGGNLKVAGTSEFTGASTFKDNVTMKKNLSVAGNSDVTGNGTFGGDLTVNGKTTLKDMLFVSGDADFKKNASVGKDLSVAGKSNLHDTKVDGKLDVTGPSNFNNNVTMKKDLSVGGNTDLKGDVNIGGDLRADKGTSYFDKSIWHEGEENQVEINNTGIRVGLNSTHMDAHGVYAGGHSWDEAKAAMHEDGRVKGIYGYLEKDLDVGGKTTTGTLDVKGNANVGGTLNADKVVTNDIQLPGGSLNRRLDNMDTRIDKVGAGAAALAGLQYAEFDPGSKFSMAMGMGHYKGKTAVAVGGQYHFSKNVSMNLAGTVGSGENMVSGGLTFRFGKPKTQTEKDNDALRAENKKLMKRLEAIEKRIENFSLIEQKKSAFPDIPTGHWARNAVETLKGNGFVEGYPDGEFKGDKRMSRYEYAQMLYRALSKGAEIKESHLKEYEPELRQIQEEQEAKAARRSEKSVPQVQEPMKQEPVQQEAQPVVQEAPEAAPPIADIPPMAEGMSRYDYARQIFEVLKQGGAIDRSLAQEFDPELRQIIEEERAKGTLPQQ